MSADLISKVATQTMTEAVVKEANKPAGQGSDFAKLLSSQLNEQTETTKKIMEVMGMGPENQLQMKAISAEGLDIQPSQITVNQEIRSTGKAYELLSAVNRDGLQMDSMIDMALSGRRFSPGELLAMQAGIAQIALTIDTTGKIIEQVNTGTKTMMQTNFA